MKLIRWGELGHERPGLVDSLGHWRDLGHHCADIGPDMLAPDHLARLAAVDPASLPLVPKDQRLGVPVSGIGNLIGIGLNYRDHAAETGLALPAEPVVFNKHTGALAGPFDDLPLPPGTAKLDWEVELSVVIGRTAWQVAETDALSFVAGYMTANDVSARDWQMERGGQWTKGKSGPGFCPLGPWLVTADEVPDPHALRLTTEVNGRRKQDGITADMVFGVRVLVSYLSRFMRLAPGDVILTGTPAGVGLGRGQFLAAGDRVEVEVQGLGRQAVRVV
ncbi:MAG TPA: fumarylacetoacetate hydrolase family protein [Magnetospirillum sp.]|jgi:ureidoglycolate lyase|nr:fumarylacetoacetate hydrolase family protein [Magnetospirillum sp.]